MAEDGEIDEVSLIKAAGLTSPRFRSIEDINELLRKNSDISQKQRNKAQAILDFQKYCEKSFNDQDENYREEIRDALDRAKDNFEDSSKLVFLSDQQYLEDVKLKYEELKMSQAVIEVEEKTGAEFSEEEELEAKEEAFIKYITGEEYQTN
ncbi:hypothetical protein [Candidatus Nanohalobium constans]|uniref:Uncharacterized protein n=1 Tax=Candidatus Nanohalobium constans TaxID=2565781 RepID=A0A5Q0UGT5_9ARCH|nr:hypothetical protein [Candidatus Nanohalobium constans]QGA80581.1 hypothetical protein LC1Nh_0692 [Candidatus Nanohalobium constans]